MDAVDQVWAYCGQRAADRHSTKGERVHAVTWTAMLSGAMDAECGVIGRVPVGDWDPGAEQACPDCAAALSTTALAPVVELAPFRRRSRRRRLVVCVGQLELFVA